MKPVLPHLPQLWSGVMACLLTATTLAACTNPLSPSSSSNNGSDIHQNGYGLRVPGLVISPYAKQGYIDHQTLSFDAYLKFIEDDFLGGSRLNPKTDGRPDPRPTVREEASILGNLANDFDFTQSLRQPVILPVNPGPGPA